MGRWWLLVSKEEPVERGKKRNQCLPLPQTVKGDTYSSSEIVQFLTYMNQILYNNHCNIGQFRQNHDISRSKLMFLMKQTEREWHFIKCFTGLAFVAQVCEQPVASLTRVTGQFLSVAIQGLSMSSAKQSTQHNKRPCIVSASVFFSLLIGLERGILEQAAWLEFH